MSKCSASTALLVSRAPQAVKYRVSCVSIAGRWERDLVRR
jgi:hypothetical protein